jgi:hypothetical protein
LIEEIEVTILSILSFIVILLVVIQDIAVDCLVMTAFDDKKWVSKGCASNIVG